MKKRLCMKMFVFSVNINIDNSIQLIGSVMYMCNGISMCKWVSVSLLFDDGCF